MSHWIVHLCHVISNVPPLKTPKQSQEVRWHWFLKVERFSAKCEEGIGEKRFFAWDAIRQINPGKKHKLEHWGGKRTIKAVREGGDVEIKDQKGRWRECKLKKARKTTRSENQNGRTTWVENFFAEIEKKEARNCWEPVSLGWFWLFWVDWFVWVGLSWVRLSWVCFWLVLLMKIRMMRLSQDPFHNLRLNPKRSDTSSFPPCYNWSDA